MTMKVTLLLNIITGLIGGLILAIALFVIGATRRGDEISRDVKKEVKAEKRETEDEKKIGKDLKEKRKLIRKIIENISKMPEDLGRHHETEHKSNSEEFIKNFEKLKELNKKIKKLDEELLRFDENDIKRLAEINELLVRNEHELNELKGFQRHNKGKLMLEKHNKLVEDAQHGINTDEDERKAVLNWLHCMKMLHPFLEAFKKIIEDENKHLKDDKFNQFKKFIVGERSRIKDSWKGEMRPLVLELGKMLEKEDQIYEQIDNFLKKAAILSGDIRTFEEKRALLGKAIRIDRKQT